MFKALPWDMIGPIATAVIFILAIVFGFILKFQKGAKNLTPTNPPMDINKTSKKTLCFRHEREIGENAAAVRIFGEALQEANRENSKQHGKIFDKLEDLGKEMITEIQKINGGQ